MRYQLPPSDFFIGNRQRVADDLVPGYLALLNANDVLPTCADGTFPFRQNSDLFYLTGVDQEETVLLLFPDATVPEDRAILFLRETDEQLRIWEGAKLTKDQARNTTGIETVKWLSEFDGTFHRLMCEGQGVYLNSNEHPRANAEVESRDSRFFHQCRRKYPLHDFRRLAPILTRMRMQKQEEEIGFLQHACDITESGFRRVLSFVRPGVMEYEIEAEYAHEFLRSGSRGFAYQPIIASGADGCILHYIDNDKSCSEGELLLMDVGAEYAYYNADMTRTIPVSGRFSPRQRDVYKSVLRVLREASQILRPGLLLKEYEKEIGKIMERELIQLGLLERARVESQDTEKPLYKQYFMHGTSHHLGLDVHDVAIANTPIEEGMVFTIEPGIYIPKEGLAVRLENDFVIGSANNFDLMETIPIEPEEIEDIMNL